LFIFFPLASAADDGARRDLLGSLGGRFLLAAGSEPAFSALKIVFPPRPDVKNVTKGSFSRNGR